MPAGSTCCRDSGCWKWWILPNLLFLILLLLASPFDLSIERRFFSDGHFVENGVTRWFYDYGFLPIVAMGGALLVLIALLVPRCRNLWRPGLFLFFTTLLGLAIITHLLLKDHWGRPRPVQIEQFGGTQDYRPFYAPDWSWTIQPFKSFPSGHAANGYSLIALAFVGRRHGSKALQWTGISLGAVGGTTMGMMRMAQGAHFLTDVLGGAWVIWFSSQLCDWIIYKNFHRKSVC